ncbi:putative membrane protein [Leptospira fainei serovar Hurstbridge str. BUT 6]|uniref:Membrane protein n=1 Tax=Leptospira fainei serovar Hurstbridge str. BUT 6 TaxID=1193011 RepID=S3VDJ5_9LEPT|nr:hypothetical protein [Leptospira fainei]EPG74535.1 putative membrane protein [Leptospira fainei serovar Hurstbridge str. BUT 6]
MKLSVILSLVGTVLCVFLAPMQSYIWNGDDSPTVILSIRSNVETFLDFGKVLFPKSAEYYVFGKLFLPVYAGILYGLYRLYAIGKIPESSNRRYRNLMILFGIAALGDSLAYWFADSWGEILRTIGFRYIEAPAILLSLISFIFLGNSIRKNDRSLGISFMLLPIFMIGSTIFFRYLPHGAILPVSIFISGLLLSSSEAPSLIRLRTSLFHLSSNRSILLLALAALACAGGMQLLERMIPISDGNGPPIKMDFRPFSTVDDALAVFTAYGQTGRLLYFWIDMVDMIFPVPLFLAVGAITFRFCAGTGLTTSLSLIPLGFLIFDILENSIILLVIFEFPNIPPIVAAFGGIITAYKLGFLSASLLLFIISLLGLGYIRVRKIRS